MFAVRVHGFGGPAALRVDEVDEPEVGPGEVLLEVDAAGVNFGDLLVRQGTYFGRMTLPIIPGWEVVGRVIDPSDSGLCVGTRVAALVASGGYAQRVAAPLKNVVPLTDDIGDHVALAMVIQGSTAWHLLETPRTVGAGDVVLVSGGGSGVTHLVLQLARARGVERLVVVCSSQAKAATVRALGAQTVVITGQDDPVMTLTTQIGTATVDHVIDMVGTPVLEAMLRCLRPGGRAVVYGVAGGAPATISSGALIRFGWTVAGLWLGHDGTEPLGPTLARLIALHRRGRLQPTLGPVLPLADAGRAHEMVAARTGVGKIMLICR
ncbi:quinone oxidoreductase family protein [Nakamurella leprariae]|uniref:Zinc-binding dehydrogenase n=1 Tax=Nakamurella leprariae TaxID=2803911 RepID=A0A938YKP1_9ACTN|nr:zinc-binding dehydrogenase [Nakamurella leprariae]MBM9469638.1 zinc-binding dehydrogenase [Nakamurella leprariae]